MENDASGNDVAIVEMNREQLIDLFVRTFLTKDCARTEQNLVYLRSSAERITLDALRACVVEAELAARTPFCLALSFTCIDCMHAGTTRRQYQYVIKLESYHPTQAKPSVDAVVINHMAQHRALHPTHTAFHLSDDMALVTIRVRCDACVDPSTNHRGHVMTMSSNWAELARQGKPLIESMYNDFVERHSSLHPTHSAMLHLLASE